MSLLTLRFDMRRSTPYLPLPYSTPPSLDPTPIFNSSPFCSIQLPSFHLLSLLPFPSIHHLKNESVTFGLMPTAVAAAATVGTPPHTTAALYCSLPRTHSRTLFALSAATSFISLNYNSNNAHCARLLIKRSKRTSA